MNEVNTRINREIKAKKVLLIDENGNNFGNIPIAEALNKADEANLDLVEVGSGDPVVCRIMDYGKWKYQHTKKAKKSAQHKKTTKEINIRPTTGLNDLKYRAKQVDKFLEAENKVKLVVKFKGREQAHAYETGKNIIEKFLKLINTKYVIYDPAKTDGRTISLMLNPSKEEK